VTELRQAKAPQPARQQRGSRRPHRGRGGQRRFG
jgi:hypothetical protein